MRTTRLNAGVACVGAILALLVGAGSAQAGGDPTGKSDPRPGAHRCDYPIKPDEGTLDRAFRAAPGPGEFLPSGENRGITVAPPGVAEFEALIWQGKFLGPDRRSGSNIAFGGFRMFSYRDYIGRSRIDGRPAIIGQYGGGLAHEIRQVCSGLWYGYVTCGDVILFRFTIVGDGRNLSLRR